MEAGKNSFEVTLDVNSNDRMKAMFYNIFFRRKWVMLYVGIFIIFSVAALIIRAFNLYNIPLPIVLCAGGLLLLMALFIASVILTSRGATTKRWIRFGDFGITTSAGRDNKHFSFKWQDMFFTGSTRGYFYIYLDASQFIIVPKRCLAPEEIEALNTYI